MKRSICFLLIACLISGCNATGTDFPAAPDLSGSEAAAESLSDEASVQWEELKRSASYYYEQDNYMLWVKDGYDFDNGSDLQVRLVSRDRTFDKAFVFRNEDLTFHTNLSDPGGRYPPETAIDTGNKTVTITIGKIHYTLNFITESAALEVSYRRKDLRPENLVAVNPSGTMELYITHEDGAGESFWGDVVVFDRTSGEIGYFGNWPEEQMLFCSEDAVLTNHTYFLSLRDIRTGRALSGAPRFDNRDNKYIVIGIAYDFERDLYLVAFRENTKDDHYPEAYDIYLQVYNDQGDLINTFETGVTIPSRLNMIQPVYLVPAGDGSVDIFARPRGFEFDDEEPMGRVVYIG